MPQLDFSTYPGQLFWLLVTFGLLLLLMTYVVVPQLEKIFKTREVRIKALLDEAESTQKAAENLIQQNQQKLEDARREVQTKIQKVLEEARQSKEFHKQEIDIYFQQKLEEADQQLRLLKEKAFQEAFFLKDELVGVLSEKILERGGGRFDA